MLSKNMTKEKILLQHYVTQLPNDVLKGLAGFKRDEPYSIPRAKLEPPLGLSWTDLVPLLFPAVERWKQELASEKGDTCRASHRFFKDVLPLFAMVIMQDGVIWTARYPRNSASMLLKTMKFTSYSDGGENQPEEKTYLQYASEGREAIKRGVGAIRKTGTTQTNIPKIVRDLQTLIQSVGTRGLGSERDVDDEEEEVSFVKH